VGIDAELKFDEIAVGLFELVLERAVLALQVLVLGIHFLQAVDDLFQCAQRGFIGRGLLGTRPASQPKGPGWCDDRSGSAGSGFRGEPVLVFAEIPGPRDMEGVDGDAAAHETEGDTAGR